MVNDPLCVWKENLGIILFKCYFHINKGYNHILLVDDGKNDDGHGKVTEDVWKNILQYLLWRSHHRQP